MTDIAEMKALITAFEKLIERHPELEVEMEDLFTKELRSLRVKSLEKVYA
jgi:hypothetical protein